MADVPLMNNPMTTTGDIIQGGASGAPSRLAIGTAGQILKVNAGATALEYDDPDTSGAAPAPWALVPDTTIVPISVQSAGAANRAFVVPATLIADCTITGMLFRVGTSSGNVDVGLYNSSFSKVASSGAVACPASGAANVNFSSSYAATAGRYYLAISFSNNTATIVMTTTTTPQFGAMYGFFMETAHPLPSTFVSAGGGRTPALAGAISGGWTP